NLRGTLFFAPLVVTAKPQRTINTHAEPVAISQEPYQPGLSLLIRGHPRLALSRDLRLDGGRNFLKSKKRQDHVLLEQVLFGGIEGFDFVVDVGIVSVKF